MNICIAVYTMHAISQNIDGGATEADGGASAPVGPSVSTPLTKTTVNTVKVFNLKGLTTFCG